jgi:hypothetical protein
MCREWCGYSFLRRYIWPSYVSFARQGTFYVRCVATACIWIGDVQAPCDRCRLATVGLSAVGLLVCIAPRAPTARLHVAIVMLHR